MMIDNWKAEDADKLEKNEGKEHLKQ